MAKTKFTQTWDAALQLADWPQTRDIPVFALSAERVRVAGFYRSLQKPVVVDELTRTLEELLSSQRYESVWLKLRSSSSIF